MIPHTIHYCWFGYNKKPKLIKKCIASWKKFHPDWDIIEWNEDNYDIGKNEYVKEAYENKKWAFVADSARFDILKKHGGIYLDTDVELLKPIPDEFMEYEAFAGFETDATVNPGLIYASIPHQRLLNKMVDVYDNKKFGQMIDGRIENIVDIATRILTEEGLALNNTFQIVDGVAVFPKEIFCCFDHETQSFDIRPDTVSIHHYFASWSPWYRKAYFRAIKYAVKLLGKDRYLKLKYMIKRKNI